MGWTWSAAPVVNLLNKYPSMAEIPEFVSRWPGLKEQLQSPLGENVKPEVREALKITLPGIKIPEVRE